MKILKNLLNTKSLVITVSAMLVLFNISYYMMANLPGYRNNMCVIGAGLTPLNVIYSLIIAAMSGILIANLPSLFKIRSAASSSGGIGAMTLGGFTLFCPLCTLPAISLFGVSFSLSFFTTYDIWIKLISLMLMGWSLYLINKKLSCDFCRV